MTENLLTQMTIRDELAMKEKVFIDLWGAKSEFHESLVNIPVYEQVESEPENEDDEFPLTEEERLFHHATLAESRAQLATQMAQEKTGEVNKFFQSAFLPLAPSQWIESEASRLNDKVWDLETFNHLAPISINAYRFLASLTDQEMELCEEKALTENIELVKGPYPLTVGAMKLPKVGHFDPLKCSVSTSQLAIRGFCQLKGQEALSELKKIWNVGRPYLKCRCVEMGLTDCKTNITWFDQVLWYLLANLEYLFPPAPSLRARKRAMRNFMKTTWRVPILTSVVFAEMRHIMQKMAKSVLDNPARRQETILDDQAIMTRKFPRKMTALILPYKYIRSPKKRQQVCNDDQRRTKRKDNTILSYYVRPEVAANKANNASASQTPESDAEPSPIPACNLPLECTPQSTITTQVETTSSTVSRPIRRSPRTQTIKSLFGK
ncbi:hypothetical protein CBR_g54647 [Chara braunii]|uniref:Uncharacterized protein n=1 Tax=Chara braunii TaxID=69332 RepID=A0A388MCK0_CHABU|nr:hypothetical protein CBR_g54647 [Chara braunii]|eukprot:GBG92202.1 hypothetical protein CBR_g54647 [Chara braunii]